MDTHHHKVTVRVKSVLDSCGDDEAPADQAMEEMMASQQVGVTLQPLLPTKSTAGLPVGPAHLIGAAELTSQRL